MIAIPMYVTLWFNSWDYSRPAGSIKKTHRFYYSPTHGTWWYFNDEMEPITFLLDYKLDCRKKLSKAIKEIRERFDKKQTFSKRCTTEYTAAYIDGDNIGIQATWSFGLGSLMPWQKQPSANRDTYWSRSPKSLMRKSEKGIRVTFYSHYFRDYVQRVPHVWANAVLKRGPKWFWVLVSGKKEKGSSTEFDCRLNSWCFCDFQRGIVGGTEPYPKSEEEWIEDLSNYLPPANERQRWDVRQAMGKTRARNLIESRL